MADERDKAHDLAEQAFDKAIDGDQAAAKKLVDQAKKLDPDAVNEVAQEVEEDKRQSESFKDKA